MSCIRSFTTQSRSLLIRRWWTYDDNDTTMIWATLATLMQTSLRSRCDLIGDICPDHIINICADHCRSLLVLVHQYHGSCIQCPAFGSYFTTVGHSRETDCPGSVILTEKLPQLRKTDRTVCKTGRTDRIVNKATWSILSRIDRTNMNGLMGGWIDGIDFLNDAPKLTFNEPVWVASATHSHFSSWSTPNLVLYGSGRAGVQLRLMEGRSALAGDVS